ncbi:MAG TPA: PHP domain-containing protein [Patescibacteria group bacterium]|nr:PHP domain-containing protein [Patescibacteria group bacterium]
MAVDLHIHTTASDGWLTPVQVVHKAQAASLAGIAITDHDTLEGLNILKEAGYLPSASPVIVPGIEFSTDLPEHEVHILAYGMDPQHQELQNYLQELIRDRLTRVEKMLAKLTQLGYPLEYRRVRELAGNAKALGRPHVARALIEKGYFLTIAEVFERLLMKNGPAYVPHYKLMPEEVIRLIHRAGGAAVLAHPGQIHNDDIVAGLITAGLDGLEAYHPHHCADEAERYQQWALDSGLLTTGGSDYHGMPGRFPEQLGVFTAEDAVLAQLQQFLHIA